MRGEQKKNGLDEVPCVGSPPLARGTAQVGGNRNMQDRITPACAGNSMRDGSNKVTAWDHPRLRGEQIYPTPAIPARGGSPPLARGTVSSAVIAVAALGITPACAGNRAYKYTADSLY